MGNKADALGGVPSTQGELDHICDCFGEDEQSSLSCFSLWQVHQPEAIETLPSWLSSGKAWMPARNRSYEASNGISRKCLSSSGYRQSHREMPHSWEGLLWNWPSGTSSKRENNQPVQWASKMPLQLALALGYHFGHVSPREMGLAFILKFCVCKKISVGSAKYAKHIRMIDFKSLMQLFFSP